MNTCEQTLKELLEKLKTISRYEQCAQGDNDYGYFCYGYPSKSGDWVHYYDIKQIIDQVNK